MILLGVNIGVKVEIKEHYFYLN